MLAISTAPSMSTTSRLVTPSTSMLPEMSRDTAVKSPAIVRSAISVRVTLLVPMITSTVVPLDGLASSVRVLLETL